MVRAGGLAVAATDAPVVVNNDNTVLFLPGGFDRTDFDAFRLPTLLTGNWHVKKVVAGRLFFGIIVAGRFKIDGPFFHFQDTDVLFLWAA